MITHFAFVLILFLLSAIYYVLTEIRTVLENILKKLKKYG
jgi:hypothetical protein